MEWGKLIQKSAFMLEKNQDDAAHFRRVDKSDTSWEVSWILE